MLQACRAHDSAGRDLEVVETPGNPGDQGAEVDRRGRSFLANCGGYRRTHPPASAPPPRDLRKRGGNRPRCSGIKAPNTPSDSPLDSLTVSVTEGPTRSAPFTVCETSATAAAASSLILSASAEAAVCSSASLSVLVYSLMKKFRAGS